MKIRSILDRNNRWIAGAAIACFAAGVLLSHKVEPGVRVQKVTLAGNTPALQFFPAGSGSHPVALLADESLFCYGEALAAAGFECVAVELPGHGTSQQSFSFMGAVHALEEVSRSAGPVDVFIGHSLGGWTGGEAVREGGMKPRLFIAVGSLPILGEHGPPLLLLAGRFDEGLLLARPFLKSRLALLAARTDTRLVLSPWSDHVLEACDPLLVNAAVEAACAAVDKRPPAPPTCWRWRLAGVALAMLGALGLGFCLPKLPPRWAWGRGLLVAGIFIVAFVLTARMWLDMTPHLRFFPRQIAAMTVTMLVLISARRLHIPHPRRCLLAVASVISVGCLVKGSNSLIMSALFFMPALLAGAVIGGIAARLGSQRDGDIAMVIVVGCGFFQLWQPPKMTPEPVQPHVAIKLDTKLLDACVGQYEFAPVNVLWEPFTFKVWRQEDHLVAQAWDNTPLGVAFDFYPESETNFFLKVNVDRGQLTFVKNEKGEVTAVMLHLFGQPDSEGEKHKN